MSKRIASFHIAEFPMRRSLSRMTTLAAERWELPTTDGCVLGKVMGTSKPDTTKTSVDLRRWAVFAVWETPDALERFVSDSPLMNRWRSQARKLEHLELRPLRSRGSWGGIDPLPGLEEVTPAGEVAILTRANVRLRHLVTFSRAVPAVDASLWTQPGCSLALGMGEWPVGQQATFSIWDSYDAVRAFAHSSPEHSEVIKRTYKEGWYSEELFARFGVIRQSSSTDLPDIR